MDGALLDRLSWGPSPTKSASPEDPQPPTSVSSDASLPSRPTLPEASSPPVHKPKPTKFSPSAETIALIVAGLHSAAALVFGTPALDDHGLSVITTRPIDQKQEQRLKKLALKVVNHEPLYGLRFYEVARGSGIRTHSLEVYKSNIVEVYSDGKTRLFDTRSLCFESMRHKLMYFVQIDHYNADFQRELGGDVTLLAKLMIFPFKVALEVQHKTNDLGHNPEKSLSTLTIRTVPFPGTNGLEALVTLTEEEDEEEKAKQVTETFAAKLIRELEEDSSASKSSESDTMGKNKQTRNQRRGRGHSKVANGEDPDKITASLSPATASASLEPHLATTTESPAEAAPPQSLEHMNTEAALSSGAVLSSAQDVIDEDTEPSRNSRLILSVTESPSKPTSSPSALSASPRMSDKPSITSPPTSRALPATPLTSSGRRVSSQRTTTSPDEQTSASKMPGTSPVHSPSPDQSKTESMQHWKALRHSESPSLGSPGSAERRKSLQSPSLKEEETLSPATPQRKPRALGKARVEGLKDTESDEEWDGAPEGAEGWRVVEPKQKRKTAKQSERGHQRNISRAKSSSDHSEGKRDTPWANKRDLIPRRPPPNSPAYREPKGSPKKVGDDPLVPKIGEENFPALPTPSVGPLPKLEAKPKASNTPVVPSASARPKTEAKVYLPVVPLGPPVTPKRKDEAKTEVKAAPVASPRAPSPKIEVKKHSQAVPIAEMKGLPSTETTSSSVRNIHDEEAPATSSRPRGEPSSNLVDIPEESILETPLPETPPDTTGSSSRDKGRSEELIVENTSLSSQLPSHLQTGSHHSSSDDQSSTSARTTRNRSRKVKNKKQTQRQQEGVQSQNMSDPRSTTAAGFGPRSSLAGPSYAPGSVPRSSLPDTSVAAGFEPRPFLSGTSDATGYGPHSWSPRDAIARGCTPHTWSLGDSLAAELDPHYFLPGTSVAAELAPHSSLLASSTSTAAYVPPMRGVPYYQVPMGQPVNLPRRPEPRHDGICRPAPRVPSPFEAPMTFNPAETSAPTQTFATPAGIPMIIPHVPALVGHLGPAGAAALMAYEAAGTPVGLIPLQKALDSTVPNKPAHFRYRLDSTGWECAKEGCEKRTNDWDGYSMICQNCGPYSRIRYCSTEHVLEDAGTHHHICPVESFRAPAVELPSRFENMLPTIQNINPPTHQLRTRQVVFNATSEAGGYAIFTDYVDWMRDGTPEDLPERANNAAGGVLFAITFEGQPEDMDRFNRVLHSLFFDEQANGAAVVYLARMIRKNLRERGLWYDKVQCQLQYQFMGEFKFMTLNEILNASSRDNCFTEWGGQAARECPEEECRRELCDPAAPYGDKTYGRGVQKHVEAMEAYHWILRAWRVFHPYVKDANDRIKGLGFTGVPNYQLGRLRGRGEGWDGYGSFGDERRI